MFDELSKYKQKDHFFLTSKDDLKKECNAPTDKSGVYLVYALKNGRIELVYIGRSGKIRKDGTMKIRKSGLGGLKDRIVNGHQFGNVPRRVSWIKQIEKENIEALDIYWYATHNEKFMDCPRLLEDDLLHIYISVYNSLPRWNIML